MMDEQEFRRHADDTLSKLNRALSDAGDDYGFEVDMNAGALTIEFDDPPGKFVVSPNTPVRQIWVSALSRSFKLDWDELEATFVHVDSGDRLKALLAKAISKHMGQEVEL